ncbi:hypothetical protein [Nocardia vulneris]|uniref:hypothetical protein n=1 Tax=Nocardia vulneris TaxID=1141657 RepID=UPI001FCCD9F8|nr:hypothetical protein [Nocardia vulneris]
MTTPMPRPGMPTPGASGPRPGVPLPGQHLPGAPGRPEPADPERIRTEIDGLLTELVTRTGWPGANATAESAETGADITRRARILEQAHDVLVQALATVDKI